MSDTPRTDAASGYHDMETACDAEQMRALERELADANAENSRLRAALANSSGACAYCSLPKDQWAACKSGFPGCARADDAMGCPELGARIELHEANARIARLEEAGEWVAYARDEKDHRAAIQAWEKAKEAKP